MPGDVAVQEAPKELLMSGVGTQTGRFAHRRYTKPGTQQGNGQRRCTETGIQVPTPVPGPTHTLSSDRNGIKDLRGRNNISKASPSSSGITSRETSPGDEGNEARILQDIELLLNLQSGKDRMRRFHAYMTVLVAALALSMSLPCECNAQIWKRKAKKAGKNEKVSVQDVREGIQKNAPQQQAPQDGRLAFFVEGNDTIYYDTIIASKIYSRIPKQKGREWREYYRLVHNFSKAYPYALVAKKMVVEADSTIAADKLKGIKREKYISKVQKELFDVFEGQMRSLTVSQGALIMKLIDREVGKSSYNIIKGYKSGITAGFWQGVAKIFGSDLKKPYDPEGEDEATEELVKMWEAGDFPAFYWSIFWKDPPEMPIPEKYR